MSFGWLFLGGLLPSRARLCFTSYEYCATLRSANQNGAAKSKTLRLDFFREATNQFRLDFYVRQYGCVNNVGEPRPGGIPQPLPFGGSRLLERPLANGSNSKYSPASTKPQLFTATYGFFTYCVASLCESKTFSRFNTTWYSTIASSRFPRASSASPTCRCAKDTKPGSDFGQR